MITYIIQSGKYHKIGKTENWHKRQKAYYTHNPDWELIQVIEGDYEDQLHHIFKDYRYKHEWFELPNNWMNIIKETNLEEYKGHIKSIIIPLSTSNVHEKYKVLIGLSDDEAIKILKERGEIK